MKSHEIIQKLMQLTNKKSVDLYSYLHMSRHNFYNTIHPEKRTYKRKDGKGSDIGLDILCATLNLLGYKLIAVPKYRITGKDEYELEPSNIIDTSTKVEKVDKRPETSKETIKVARATREKNLLDRGVVMKPGKPKKTDPVLDDGTEIELSEEALWKMKLEDFD